MSKTMKSILALGVLALISGASGSAIAADCVIHFKRIACTGQEAESFKKCDGKAECDESKALATTEEACLKAAQASCENTRVDVTKYKSITATFKGASLTGGFAPDGKADPKGANFCAANRPDMNKCQ